LGRARGPEDIGERRRGLTQYECAPGLDDAGLLTGDVSERGSDGLGMVEGDVGYHRHLAVGDVGRVPAPAEADLHEGGVDAGVGEPTKGGGGEDLEYRRRRGDEHLDAADGLDD